MKNKVAVSVIVPVYNVEKYLRKCLDSFVTQTLDDLEIIIVNDGSTDGSQYIINEYVSKYPDKIVAFMKDNSGLGEARNFGLQKAKGNYIGFVDLLITNQIGDSAISLISKVPQWVNVYDSSRKEE